MQRFKQPNMDLHPDGEWIRYSDHVEAMKRIAGDTTPPIVAGFVRVYDEVNGPISAEPSATSRQASTAEWLSGKSVIARVAPSASAQPAEPVEGKTKALFDLRRLPAVTINEIDGEESDGTPKTWRRPYVSRRRVEELLDALYAAPAPASPAALTDEREAKPLTRFVRYLNEHCIGQTITEESLEEWVLDVLDSTPRDEPKHPPKSKGLFASSALLAASPTKENNNG